MKIEIKNAVKEYDVIVVGGGPAGCAAAVASARRGARTLIIETGSALGGMATLGMVSKWAPFTDREKVIYDSIAREIFEGYKKKMGYGENEWNWVTIAPEELKVYYDELVTESGADILFESRVCHCEVRDGNVDTVIVSNKAGLTPYRARVYVDATGEGDVAAMSGVPFDVGDENGDVQSSSLCFVLSDVDYDAITESINSNLKDGLWARVCREGKFPLVCKHFIPARVGEGTLFANAGHLERVDSTDPEQTTAALIKGRQIAEEYLRALKHYLPEAFKNAHITATAQTLGVRESRRIRGEYCLTVEDYLLRRSFPDEIARNSYWLDCHGAGFIDTIPPEKRRYGAGESHGIPWRCMIPLGVDNLIVAGRAISMDRSVLASVRVMPNCLAMGEAAGIGASIAARDGEGVRAVEVSEIQAGIKKDETVIIGYAEGKQPTHEMLK